MFVENGERQLQLIELPASVDIGFYEYIKRAFDVMLALFSILAFFPLFAVICLLVVLESEGSPIYSQERMGKDGEIFRIYKIRSMYLDAEADGPRWADINDCRITGVGKLIRKTRLDELPQLFNILSGKMSFVGPRPERAVFTLAFERQIPGFIERLRVKPGLTGLAQINGGYDLTPGEKLKLDLEYISTRNLWLDIWILLKTLTVVVSCKGAR